MKARKFTVGMTLGALLGVLAACSSAGVAAASKGTLTIGGVIAITGSSNFEAGNVFQGVYPAIYEINKAGGVLGHKLELKPVDTKSDPADALPAVQQMLATTSHLVGVVGVDTSSAPTLVPVLNRAKITMTIVAGESAYNKSHFKYMWRLFPPDSANGTAMALWAKRKGYTRIAAVFGSDPGSQGDLPGVIQSLKALHVPVVTNITLTPDQSSYQSQVNQLIAAHPQVIMTESDSGTAGTFFGELKSLGGLVPIIGTQATDGPQQIVALRAALGPTDFKKYYSAVISSPSSVTPAVTEWNKMVKADVHQLGVSASSAQGNPIAIVYYDGMIAMALSMVAAHSTNPKVYNGYMSKVCNPGKGKTVVYTFAQGVKALKKGKQIQYVGATGLIDFNKYHNSYGNQEAVSLTATGGSKPLGTITVKQIEAVPVKGVA